MQKRRGMFFLSGIVVLALIIFYQIQGRTHVLEDDFDFDYQYYAEDGTVGILGTIEGDIYDKIIIPSQTVERFPGQNKIYNMKSIEVSAFQNYIKLKIIEIPNNVISIGESAFENCYNLEKVVYHGSKEEWQNIQIGKNNQCLTNAYIIYKEK